MSPVIIGIIGFAAVVGLIFLSVPVAFSMIVVGFVGFSVLNSVSSAMNMLCTEVFTSFTSYTMSVVPLFAFMGILAAYSGLGAKLFAMADKFVGHITAGLAVATQLACGIFGAICGSIPATLATMGPVVYPEMKKKGYDDSFSTATIASGSNLAVMIPPSTTFIIYGLAAEVSIGKLFIAGIFPGILEMLLFMIAGVIVVKMNPKLAPRQPKATWEERVRSLTHGGVLEILIVFCISIGGIFIGWFTATEAGAVGAFCMLAVCAVRRNVSVKILMESLLSSTALAAMCFLLIASANVFTKFFAITGIPASVGRMVLEMNAPPWAVLFVIVFIYLIMGMLMDALAMILLTIPIFYPVIIAIGYDPVWFGVLAVLVLSLGFLTPPIGLGAFILHGSTKVPIYTIFKGVWPYVIATLITVIIIIFVPSVATFLPGLL
ncbi:MAG: TRAP transporter large permease [Clostridiales Family XIII bacterium]|jgi:tripartite ATP-independent transporter DctM subunit|nr:TRAP transporter large permease [Clostridiales Family XIII bacterium]